MLPAGGTRLFSFDVSLAGPIGIGVRAEPEVVDCELLDLSGRLLGSGVVQMPQLEPGTYLLALRAPPDVTTVQIRPALAGVEHPTSDPPDDVVRRYIELAGMRSLPEKNEDSRMRKCVTAAGLLGFLVLVTQVAYGSHASAVSLQGSESHAGTTLVPDNLLRRWDPVTIFFDSDRGRAGGGEEINPSKWVTVTPDRPGAYTWLDARTLQFRPAEPWPPLARYQWLVEGQTFTLATLMTPPVQSIPVPNAEGLEEVTAVTLTFSEPMDPEALARMVTIELQPLPGMGSGEERWLTREDFQVKPLERKSRSDAATYVLALHHPIPLGTFAVVHLRLSLDDGESESFTTIEFSTAQPFRITSAGCRANVYPVTREGTRYTRDQAIDCGSGERSLDLRFSAPLRALGPVEARNLVRLTPVVENLSFSVYDKTLKVTGNFAWETLYQVDLVPHAISDVKGRQLDMTGESRIYLYFPRKPAYLQWGASQGIIERFGPQSVPVEGRADERVDLRIHVLDPLDRSFWPFPERPVTVDESKRPPGPGEETRSLSGRPTV